MAFSVLIVDDEKMPREILKKYIPWKNLQIDQVAEAEDGLQAVEAARNFQPDIVISDMKMPRMNGLELAEQIRSLYPQCRFIFLSGYADKEYLKGAIRLKAFSYVEKPIDLDEITAVLKEVIQDLRASLRTDPLRFFYRGENDDFSRPLNTHIYSCPDHLLSSLDKGIRHKKQKETLELLNQLFDSFTQCEGTPPDTVRNLCSKILFSLISAAETRKISPVVTESQQLLYSISGFETLSQLREKLFDILNLYFNFEEKNSLDLVSRVDNYLESHYMDCTLTVQAIASDLGFVNTYLCGAYKKNTGITINQKLTKIRLKEAKRLLSDPSRKLYSIAHDVGYSDGKYFVKLFTKEIGISPRLYQENLNYHEN